jgi:hypothetical protein
MAKIIRGLYFKKVPVTKSHNKEIEHVHVCVKFSWRNTLQAIRQSVYKLLHLITCSKRLITMTSSDKIYKAGEFNI